MGKRLQDPKGEKVRERVDRCDLCGGDPACVRVCYTEALFLSDYQLTARGMGRQALMEQPH